MAEVTYRPGDSDERPWGRWQVLEVGEGFVVKRITVSPGGLLSLQLHHHRSEHWVVVRGRARVTCDERVFELAANESTFIPVRAAHRIENPGAEPLELIEVQCGARLDENDIVRLEDRYGRG
ncbi:phosphomannose isomerase type II C-terminal cupin domain [Geminicoccaceae bacterium 1502E]|nr:phosphomannose isomerase type II C-terminal cupin domain [Geminicoccaceae bacterium 1502E]